MISFYTRALLLLDRRPPCWNKHSAARTTQHVTSRLAHVVSWSNKWNLGYTVLIFHGSNEYSVSIGLSASVVEVTPCRNSDRAWDAKRQTVAHFMFQTLLLFVGKRGSEYESAEDKRHIWCSECAPI